MNQLDVTITVERAQKLLEKHVGLTSKLTDLGYESVLLGKDELDPKIVPKTSQLPNEVLTHQYLWIEPVTAKEYLVYFLTTIDCQRVLAQGIVVDHKLVWSEGNQCRN